MTLRSQNLKKPKPRKSRFYDFDCEHELRETKRPFKIGLSVKTRGGFFVGFPIPRKKIPIPWDFLKKSGIKSKKNPMGLKNPGISGKSQKNPKYEKNVRK